MLPAFYSSDSIYIYIFYIFFFLVFEDCVEQVVWSLAEQDKNLFKLFDFFIRWDFHF